MSDPTPQVYADAAKLTVGKVAALVRKLVTEHGIHKSAPTKGGRMRFSTPSGYKIRQTESGGPISVTLEMYGSFGRLTPQMMAALDAIETTLKADPRLVVSREPSWIVVGTIDAARRAESHRAALRDNADREVASRAEADARYERAKALSARLGITPPGKYDKHVLEFTVAEAESLASLLEFVAYRLDGEDPAEYLADHGVFGWAAERVLALMSSPPCTPHTLAGS